MRWLVIGIVLLSTVSCNSMKINQFDQSSPVLVLEDFFEGRTQAWGVFEDRFGNLKRSFTVDITGIVEGDMLVLDERFVFDDGELQQRVWHIKLLGDGKYVGFADDVIGQAHGEQAGNALRWQYRLALEVDGRTWQVNFDDWMFLQPGNVLINRAKMSKWGLNLGSVSLFFYKSDHAPQQVWQRAGMHTAQQPLTPPINL
ncbi:DUF3833 domain-containing protein [Aliagarivorans marinus]|uniref:DUF3833 domain-containing protein n=1 Tax=Aliagarivorans marinus TaxID=561965 RepID=UPI0004278340|nr:DUF3833 domain-containing protein [Aliagarivorans marinus]